MKPNCPVCGAGVWRDECDPKIHWVHDNVTITFRDSEHDAVAITYPGGERPARIERLGT